MPAMTAIGLSPQATLLVRARLVPGRLTSADIRKLNRLTAAEVRALISIGRKVGRGSRVRGFFIF